MCNEDNVAYNRLTTGIQLGFGFIAEIIIIIIIIIINTIIDVVDKSARGAGQHVVVVVVVGQPSVGLLCKFSSLCCG